MTNQRVHVVLDIWAEVPAPNDDDDQAETPWSRAAYIAECAANGPWEVIIREPEQPAGEHHYGVILNNEARRLYCSIHQVWENVT